MIEAGSSTTSSALHTAILYLASDREAQKRAHDELDLQIPPHRSPTFADSSALPYISAIIKETFRIRPLTRYGTPHYTLATTSYKGTSIPAHTYIVINQYALHFDPVYHPNPTTFNPSRYLDHPHSSAHYAVLPDCSARDHYNFGAGRRICPGIHLAENSMSIVLAKLLWAFAIVPSAEDPTVNTSDEAFQPGANTVPKPFKVCFIPRSARRKEIIRQEWARAKENGYEIRGARVDISGVVVG